MSSDNARGLAPLVLTLAVVNLVAVVILVGMAMTGRLDDSGDAGGDDVRGQASPVDGSFSDLRTTMLELEREKAGLEARLNSATEDLSDKREELRAAQARIRELSDARPEILEGLQQRVQTLEAAVESSEDTVGQLEDALADVTAERDSLQEQLDTLTAAHEKRGRELKAAEMELELVRNKNENLNNELKMRQDQIVSLQEDLRDLEAHVLRGGAMGSGEMPGSRVTGTVLDRSDEIDTVILNVGSRKDVRKGHVFWAVGSDGRTLGELVIVKVWDEDMSAAEIVREDERIRKDDRIQNWDPAKDQPDARPDSGSDGDEPGVLPDPGDDGDGGMEPAVPGGDGGDGGGEPPVRDDPFDE